MLVEAYRFFNFMFIPLWQVIKLYFSKGLGEHLDIKHGGSSLM